MKIGDNVRFLSETGGGKVVGFQSKNIVLIEDEDGFEIPFPVNEVVVIGNEDYSMSKVVNHKTMDKKEPDKRSVKERLTDTEDEVLNDYDPSDNFDIKPIERKGGDMLSAYLAFVPVDIHDIANTKFESYFVNDSNYYIHYSYLTAEGASWTLRFEGEIEPNTKEFIEEFGREQLNEISHTCMQMIAYKRDKSFMLKPAVDVQFRVDSVKFYKLHTFRENDFFERPALLYAVIENDKPLRPLVIDAKSLKTEMYTKVEECVHNHQTRRDDLVRRYSEQQSKSRKVKQHLKDDKIVVDLHINELLETTVGMNASDIFDYQLDVFRNTLNQYKGKKGQKLIFIHGKGEGVLRQAIIHELNYRYKQYTYQDASFQEFGYGATQVTIK